MREAKRLAEEERGRRKGRGRGGRPWGRRRPCRRLRSVANPFLPSRKRLPPGTPAKRRRGEDGVAEPSAPKAKKSAAPQMRQVAARAKARVSARRAHTRRHVARTSDTPTCGRALRHRHHRQAWRHSRQRGARNYRIQPPAQRGAGLRRRRVYVVRRGDTLSRMSRRFYGNAAGRFRRVYRGHPARRRTLSIRASVSIFPDTGARPLGRQAAMPCLGGSLPTMRARAGARVSGRS